jgi:hypothetical protein
MDRKDEDRGFGPDEGKARIACWEHAAPSLARNVANTLRNPVAAPFVTLDLDIVEPGALQTLLQALKRLGAVTAAEVRHVTASMAEIRVFTRVGGPVLQSALVREVSGKLAVVPNLSTKDRLALRVRIVGPSALEGNP